MNTTKAITAAIDYTDPHQVDEALAALYHVRTAAAVRIGWADNEAQAAKGGHGFIKEKNRFGHLYTVQESWELLEAALADPDEPAWSKEKLQRIAASRDENRATYQDAQDAILELDGHYTGWSRFFLVISSAGHIHRSQECHTCRVTTEYGWLPKLSGKSEDEAVEKLGPKLCSVCFPSAPVEHQGGKITKAQARKLAA